VTMNSYSQYIDGLLEEASERLATHPEDQVFAVLLSNFRSLVVEAQALQRRADTFFVELYERRCAFCARGWDGPNFDWQIDPESLDGSRLIRSNGDVIDCTSASGDHDKLAREIGGIVNLDAKRVRGDEGDQ